MGIQTVSQRFVGAEIERSLTPDQVAVYKLRAERNKKQQNYIKIGGRKIILIIIIIIIIMYIYHAFINALSAHMIHIDLNMIFYTHVEQHM